MTKAKRIFPMDFEFMTPDLQHLAHLTPNPLCAASIIVR